MTTNFGAAAVDYAKHRAGFPESFFERVERLGLFREGDRVVDVGTGTGTLARGFARRGARVVGIDPDERLMEQARALDGAAGVHVEYLTGKAERIPLPDACAELVSAGQCWHWFDGAKAAAEFARIAKPGARALVAHFDWVPLPGNVVEATERLILAYNPAWRLGGGDGIHPESLPHLHAAGFREVETFSYDMDALYTPEAWRGRIRASAGVGASLPPDRVRAFDMDLARLLAESFPAEVLAVHHRVFAISAKLGPRA